MSKIRILTTALAFALFMPATQAASTTAVTSNLPREGEAIEDGNVEEVSIYNNVKEESPSTNKSLPHGGRLEGAVEGALNLLRWATLTPDIGVEWHIDGAWAVLVHGTWTSWNWNDSGRRHALWEVSPEVRLYLGRRKAWHVGAMGKAGHFNYKFSETGRQGDIYGGGITGGYKLPLGKRLALDFSLGLGYLRADYEKYEVDDGVRVRAVKEAKDWWGPINAEVTLGWRIF